MGSEKKGEEGGEGEGGREREREGVGKGQESLFPPCLT